MYILGIDSATPVAAVAVTAGENILAERIVNNRKTHSINLLPMVKASLEDAGVAFSDLGGIAVSSGPGSFTGLRIGMTAARTLAHVLEIPIAGVSTLDALAHRFSGPGSLVCPILNARRNEVYAGIYRGGERLEGPAASGIKDLCSTLYKYGDNILMLGDGVPPFKEKIMEYLGARVCFVPESSFLPGGTEVAHLGYKKIKNDQYTTPFKLLPDYVRLSEAEIKWRKKHGSGVECGK
ncbi:MAG: tRNA (adenosine(37)-N6)-threonylcarbamoyltransferase complex dimerization subunit type 1 TsaB [Clostridiales bacterium]|nr:tRNA (adenosine(37)-N6)-threonylcarbamoyltransferase complex dimerization subunit type 1 TsaB [Clostridiales bacterium]MCF8023340.1 tRNA (adenosine(37)-N6)-threonylcarbamoyltransferase complex dimerization subunit type 1 TsaB [Clostridiales bacterium]